MKAKCMKCCRSVTLTPAAEKVLRAWERIDPYVYVKSEYLRRHKCEHGVWCVSCHQTHKVRGAA